MRIPARLFGSPSIGAAGQALTAPRHIAVWAYLAVARPSGLHSRDTLAALLWPESTQERARHALRNVLHAIRKVHGADAIVSAGDSLVGLNLELYECDVVAFRDDIRCSAERALALYSAPLLKGFHVSGATDFEEWLESERRSLAASAIEAARNALAVYRLARDVSSGLAIASRAHEIAPDDEPIVRRLIELQMASGDRHGAERTYASFCRRITEFGAQPSAETSAIVQPVRPSTSARVERPTKSDAAYTAYVRGTYLFLRAAPVGDTTELERCRQLFEEALALDPDFAHAWAGLSNYYAVAAARNILRPFASAFEHALALSRRALALDPNQAIPHVHFGVEAMYVANDWHRAGEEFRIATRLDPSYAEAHRFLGIYLAAVGRYDEAMASFRESVRLEPHIALFRNTLADGLMGLGQYPEALVELHHALTLEPRYTAARERLVRCLERVGSYEDAITARRGVPAMNADRFASAFAEAGEAGYRCERERELRELIDTVSARLSSAPPENAGEILIPPQLRLSLACAELGDWSGARAWMEHACATRPGQRPWFISHPELAPLGE